MKPALLIIDVQKEYFAPHGQWVIPEGEEALQQIQKLLAAFRQHNLPVFHIVHEELDPASPVFSPGSRGVEMHPAMHVLPGEITIVKHFPGAFTQTPLEAYLHLTGRDTLVICGYMTHMCCDTTTRQATEHNLSVLFAADATATRDLTSNGQLVPHRTVHETTLAIMAEFANVLTTQEIIEKVAAASPIASA
jgi:nicotinamidase-related amidase